MVRTAVPVSLRTSDEPGQLTNRVAPVFVNLPCGEDDPLRRLHRIRVQMDDLKRSHQEVGSTTLTRLTDTAVAPALLTLATRTPLRLHNPVVQTITTNVPGPQFPLYVLGRKALELHPYVPITGGMRVATAIFSYLGRLNFGITGDFDAMPDLEVLAKGIRAGFDELAGKAEEARQRRGQ
jgi:diacylglycerol O-acyltransferase